MAVLGDPGSIFASQCLYAPKETADGSSGLVRSVQWSIDLLERDHPNGWLLVVFVRMADRARHNKSEEGYLAATDRLADVVDTALTTLSGDARRNSVVAVASPYKTSAAGHAANTGAAYVLSGSHVNAPQGGEISAFSDVIKVAFPKMACTAKLSGTVTNNSFVNSWREDSSGFMVWIGLSGILTLLFLVLLYMFCGRLTRQVSVVRTRRFSPCPMQGISVENTPEAGGARSRYTVKKMNDPSPIIRRL